MQYWQQHRVGESPGRGRRKASLCRVRAARPGGSLRQGIEQPTSARLGEPKAPSAGGCLVLTQLERQIQSPDPTFTLGPGGWGDSDTCAGIDTLSAIGLCVEIAFPLRKPRFFRCDPDPATLGLRCNAPPPRNQHHPASGYELGALAKRCS